MDSKNLEEILEGLIGQIIIVINPLSYIPTLTGPKIDVNTYKAKVVSCENGILRILIDYLRDPHKNVKEKAYQFVPIDQIKRVMISKTERFVTL